MGWKQQRAYAHSGSERKRPSVNVIESALASTCTKNHSRKLRQDAGIVMQPLLAVGRLLHDSVQGIPQAAAESQPTNKPARKTNVRGLRGEGGICLPDCPHPRGARTARELRSARKTATTSRGCLPTRGACKIDQQNA